MITEALRRAFGDGTFTAKEAALVLGIKGPSSTLNRLKASGVLERVSRGVYRFAPLDRWESIDARLERETVLATRADRESVTVRIAAERWKSWRETGYVTRTAPRRYKLALRPRPKVGLRVQRR